MDKKDLERRLEAAENQVIGLLDEIKNLESKLDEVQDEEIPEFPVFERGDAYYYSDSNFELVKSDHSGYCGKTGEYDIYNAFHSEEYAKLYADKCREIAMLLHCRWYLCYDHHPDFNDGNIQKWTVVFNYNEGKFTVEFSRMREWSTIYFDTEENAQKCAEWLNEHWRDCDD